MADCVWLTDRSKPTVQAPTDCGRPTAHAPNGRPTERQITEQQSNRATERHRRPSSGDGAEPDRGEVEPKDVPVYSAMGSSIGGTIGGKEPKSLIDLVDVVALRERLCNSFVSGIPRKFSKAFLVRSLSVVPREAYLVTVRRHILRKGRNVSDLTGPR